MAQALQLLPQLGEIVDLAVEDDGLGAVLIEDRLVAACKIDDAKPPVSETHAVAEVITLGIRPPIPLNASHPLHEAAVDGMISVGVNNASDATHLLNITFVRVPALRARTASLY
jgi:hypothetical protein